MSKAWNWIVPHMFGILAALLAGPILGRLASVHAFSIPALSLSGNAAVRLGADVVALALLLSLALNAYREIPDNGRGSSFLRHIVIPLAVLTAIVYGDKAFRGVGLPLVERFGSVRYLWAYTSGIIASGLWLTVAWLSHLGSLREAFCPARHVKRPGQHASADDESGETNLDGVQEEEPQDGSATMLLTGTPPSMLGRYKVLKELGRGAMGIVYLGKDPTIQRFVAIKTMRLDQIDDGTKLQEVKARFFREAESAGRLSHPNIVTIYDAGEQDELGYIAMEVLEGSSLKQWSRPPNLMSVADVVHALTTVAEALDHAHQQGVVHRDVKPANVMLTKDRIVKVMDFGIAKMASSSKTQTDLVLGTPTYMSPEQIAGKKVDGRSDIFSLGVVLFELLTGRPPFIADNLSALLFAIAHQPHPPLNALRKDLPPMFQEVLDRALQKELPQRYRRAGEFARDLRACLQSLAA
ncbi:putative serine/threonine protein kinase [Nitrospira japonica]|uniref:non-specific serine/threonine protein kinase n=1 Tax=Nitrospira japonica TaxID=1325564 RepID=A0A1W1I6Z9_9BACT|nr:serine/threonine-protein kinase [Nitrospira japonica]SLM48808.1 putative serine/threonine protein kinase [Nitrospira japonica]